MAPRGQQQSICEIFVFARALHQHIYQHLFVADLQIFANGVDLGRRLLFASLATGEPGETGGNEVLAEFTILSHRAGAAPVQIASIRPQLYDVDVGTDDAGADPIPV